MNRHSQPIITIVTPVYNGGDYLQNTLESVQAQTYKNIIHVVLDNASSDSTPAIIERFLDRRVPIVAKRNKETVPAAANWSAAAALMSPESKYFSILCADDTLMPTAIEKMVSVAESDPEVELVGCLARRGKFISPTMLPTGQSVFDGKQIAISFLEKISNDLPHMWGLYRRSDKDFEQDFFSSDVALFDTDACLRALARGKFGYVHEPLAFIREHEGQLTKKLLKQSRHLVFEPLVLIDRWAPVLMSSDRVAKCRQRHLKAIYRYMLYWRATQQRELVSLYEERLKKLAYQPTQTDYCRATLEWPVLTVNKRIRDSRAWQHTEALGFGKARYPSPLFNHLSPKALASLLRSLG